MLDKYVRYHSPRVASNVKLLALFEVLAAARTFWAFGACNEVTLVVLHIGLCWQPCK